MDEVQLIVTADVIPPAVTDALRAGARDWRRYASVADSKEQMARYVHWESDGEVPVRLAGETATFADVDACDAVLNGGGVGELLRGMRDTVDVAVGRPRVIVDGRAEPGMVKASYIFRRLETMPLVEFREHWFSIHGALWAKVPGVVRYVQNHPLEPGSPLTDTVTHHGWSDIWFEDLESFSRGLRSPERHETSKDGALMLDYDSLRIFVTFEQEAAGR
ncbi:MAG: hypothetical protein BGO95_03235 [Micrococcales bacterium 73-13]|nr:MAG: hypothetical protein BGO95_03235 [Micrococcales bacterium 73-13]